MTDFSLEQTRRARDAFQSGKRDGGTMGATSLALSAACDPSGLYLDWLAEQMTATRDPVRINTIKRVAGNVKALAGL